MTTLMLARTAHPLLRTIPTPSRKQAAAAGLLLLALLLSLLLSPDAHAALAEIVPGEAGGGSAFNQTKDAITNFRKSFVEVAIAAITLGLIGGLVALGWGAEIAKRICIGAVIAGVGTLAAPDFMA